jgi:hypothetical protein
VKPFEAANHNPRLKLNGVAGTAPVFMDVSVGEAITLDAAGSDDPDGNKLSYRWFHYAEAGFVPGQNMAGVEIAQADRSQAKVKIATACRPDWLHTNKDCAAGVAHIILAVTDDGAPTLTSYRRAILNVKRVP